MCSVMSIASLIKRHYRSAAVLLGVFAVMFGSLLFVNQALANSDNPVVKAGERLVNIYDRGAGRTIITKARTIRETLKAANIKVDEKQDVVEPSLDTDMAAEKYNINIYRARPITIVDNGKCLKVTTAQQMFHVKPSRVLPFQSQFSMSVVPRTRVSK